jgi:CheY-like chemotaxis protein
MSTRIMVVDDEPLVCRLLSYQLGGAGYEVITFQSGFAALGCLAATRPDLVILDVMMPEISGWDLCREIRSTSAVPVIMLTAKQGESDVVTGLNSGADDYLGKPFSLPQLLARVEAVLRRSQLVHAAQQRSLRDPRAASHEPQLPRLASRRSNSPPAVEHPRIAAPVAIDRPLPSPPPPAEPSTPSTPPAPVRLGTTLRSARLARGQSLHDAEHGCGVRWEYLQAIEQEYFDFMPRPALRQALQAYGSYLSVDLRAFVTARPTYQPALFSPLALSAALMMMIMVVVIGLYIL